MLSFLRRSSKHVVFISDAPTLVEAAPGCVARHMTAVSACTTKRGAALLRPKLRARELEPRFIAPVLADSLLPILQSG